MSYRESLEAAGAVVHHFKEFGSYQGDWWAKVVLEGREGWINGSYGSCSGCDSFKAEFGWDDEPQCADHRYGPEAKDCQLCAAMAKVYQIKLAQFGKRYTDNVMTQEAAEKEAAANLEWDSDAADMFEWIKAHG
jgi:hypothetical protein